MDNADKPKRPASTADVIFSKHSPELVFALCGPIGSPLHEVAEHLKAIMETECAYACGVIKLGGFISKQFPEVNAPVRRFERLQAKINCGNKYRERCGASVLVDLAIDKISTERGVKDPERGYQPRRRCYIIDSIKNINELEALRAVYGETLHCIGVYAPIQVRVSQLAMDMELSRMEPMSMSRPVQEPERHDCLSSSADGNVISLAKVRDGIRERERTQVRKALLASVPHVAKWDIWCDQPNLQRPERKP